MQPFISTFVDSFLALVLLYKYQALFGISFFAAFALPLPASSTIAAAGAFASQGFLDLGSVLVIAFAGNVMGDATGYLLARHYGKSFMEKIGFAKLLHKESYHELEDFISHFSGSLIFLTRFLTQVGPTVNVLAGLMNISVKQFFLFDVIGELCYVLLYAFVGYFLGSQWENNVSFLAEGTLMILSIGALISFIQWRLFKNHRKHHPA